jgi:hypothetical protein
MAKVQGVKEKLHMSLYDAFFVPKVEEKENPDRNEKKFFSDFMTDPRVIRFFVDVQNKTRLETNLQAAGVLPSMNSFETRAMRVVVSGIRCDRNLAKPGEHSEPADPLKQLPIELNEAEILADLIYNSVTSLIVGEKTMIEMPTYWFPAGAGVTPGFPTISNHGEPDPMATFRFAEPVIIEPHQSFRVEMLFPRGVPGQDEFSGDRVPSKPLKLAGVRGPLRIWVVLDGYLTRDVQ